MTPTAMEKFVVIVMVAIGGIVLYALLTAIPLMLLWNWLMPMIFGLVKIGFWQALGLALLARLIFGYSGSSSSKK